jgi:alanyl-tRNA synthetase
LAPIGSTQGSSSLRGTLSGDDAFRLYDTFGFPIDLTELMARERGYLVDIAGFEEALAGQRKQSQDERKSRQLTVSTDDLFDAAHWRFESPEAAGAGSRFVGYDRMEVSAHAFGVRDLGDGRVAVQLSDTPFYAESGGQVSDAGEIIGAGWRLLVDNVKKRDGTVAMIGTLEGSWRFGTVVARVPMARRQDTQRNHTATHLLHAALREALGEHVHQAGSLVAPDRLRFDFTHHGPMSSEELARVERRVNDGIWASMAVDIAERPYAEAVADGAMALFGEKYGDVVRVVRIADRSTELCGGTHVRNTAEIAGFRIVSEGGVAAGVRRIEAVTGARVYELARAERDALDAVAGSFKLSLSRAQGSLEAFEESVQLLRRKVDGLAGDKKALEKKLAEALRSGGGGVDALLASASMEPGVRTIAAHVTVGDAKELQALGDTVRERLASGVAVLAARFEDGKGSLLVVVTDDLRDRGLRADALVRDVAAAAGGRGGGKAHMAQAGVPDATRLDDALAAAPAAIRALLGSLA